MSWQPPPNDGNPYWGQGYYNQNQPAYPGQQQQQQPGYSQAYGYAQVPHPFPHDMPDGTQQYQQPSYQTHISPYSSESPQEMDDDSAVSAATISRLEFGGSKRNNAPRKRPPAKGKRAKRLVLGKKCAPAPPKPSPQPESTKSESVSSPTVESRPNSDVQNEETTPNQTMRADASPDTVRASEPVPEADSRPHLNVIFCGHVDAGKSTISGALLISHGLVDEREVEQLRREAERLHREGWEKAYVMDVSDEERERGKTHETGIAYFETKERRITILDAPGHRGFVPAMIDAAAQADVAVLVVSARSGEFETGFQGGGQTIEHTHIVNIFGVRELVCVINKMDECGWDKVRFDEIVKGMKPFFRANGFVLGRNLEFLPVAGLLKDDNGISSPVSAESCGWWYDGEKPYASLVEYLNCLDVQNMTRDVTGELCMPLAGYSRAEGIDMIYGKIERGHVRKGQNVTLLPSGRTAVVDKCSMGEHDLEGGSMRDFVSLHLRLGTGNDIIRSGYVLTASNTTLKATQWFRARVQMLRDVAFICQGSQLRMFLHQAREDVIVDKLLALYDPKTRKTLPPKKPTVVQPGQAAIMEFTIEHPVTMCPSTILPRLGRFVLQHNGTTIAGGHVMKIEP